MYLGKETKHFFFYIDISEWALGLEFNYNKENKIFYDWNFSINIGPIHFGFYNINPNINYYIMEGIAND